LMKVQDSYYYQDFSYVVRVGAAIASWRSEIKKAVHPAGFAMFGEVSITNKVAVPLTVPVSGITTATPELASLFEAVLTAVIGMRLGTDSDGTTLLGQTEMKGTTDHGTGTLKRGSHRAHQTPLTSTVESITRSSTTATVETTGPHGVEAGEQVEISGVDTDGYNGVYEVVTATDDTFTITVSNSLTTPAVLSAAASVLLISPFDNSTRDLTMRSHKDIDIFPIYGGWATNQRNRYGLGPRQSNATKYMWAAPPIADTTPSRMDNIGYAYPNIIRRGSPETGTDNVDAGSAGVYDETMEYTNIQIGAHESDVHMRISDFADVVIGDIVRGSRTIGESSMENDIDFILLEDGSYELTEASETVMPLTSRKIWNVPPPSYIRLITS